MQAINLTLTPVELDPVNGPGMLAAAVEESEGAHVRELAELTPREEALAAAGTIALTGKRPKPSGGGPKDDGGEH